MQFRDSEVIFSRLHGFIQSLNNHLLDFWCVPGNKIIIISKTRQELLVGWLGLTRGLPGCKAHGTVLFNRVLVMGGTGRPTLLLRQARGYGDFSGSPATVLSILQLSAVEPRAGHCPLCLFLPSPSTSYYVKCQVLKNLKYLIKTGLKC